MMGLKICLIGLIIVLGFSVINETYDRLTKRGKVVAVFEAFDNPNNAKVAPKIQYKYEVNGKTYYYTGDNVLKTGNGENLKIKLLYNVTDPNRVALDAGWISVIVNSILLIVSCLAKYYLAP